MEMSSYLIADMSAFEKWLTVNLFREDWLSFWRLFVKRRKVQRDTFPTTIFCCPWRDDYRQDYWQAVFCPIIATLARQKQYRAVESLGPWYSEGKGIGDPEAKSPKSIDGLLAMMMCKSVAMMRFST